MANISKDRASRAIDWTGEHVVTTVHTARRRYDMALLRFQARLESPRVDRVFPWFVALCLWVILALLAVARSKDLGLSSTLGHYLQALHLMESGVSPEISELGINIFAQHAAFIFFPIAFIARVFPPTETLLVIQSFAISIAVVPLWRIGRESANLRVGACGAITLAYVLHPSIQNLNLAGFHPEVFALPALLAAYLQGQKERWWAVAGFLLIVLTSRSDLGLAVTALGIVFILEDKPRKGALIGLLGFSWFLIMAFVIQPIIGNGQYPHLESFSSYGSGSFGVLLGLLSDPLSVLGDLFARESFEKALLLVAPVLFLPLVRMRYLSPILPLLAFYLIAEVSTDDLYNPQQDVALLTFVFIGAVYALTRIGQAGVKRILVDKRVLAVLALTAIVFFVRDAASSPYEEPWAWGQRDVSDIARLDAVKNIEIHDRVLTHSSAFNLVAERDTVKLLPSGDYFLPSLSLVTGIDTVIFDSNDLQWKQNDIETFGRALQTLGFKEEFNRSGIQVFSKRP